MANVCSVTSVAQLNMSRKIAHKLHTAPGLRLLTHTMLLLPHLSLLMLLSLLMFSLAVMSAVHVMMPLLGKHTLYPNRMPLFVRGIPLRQARTARYS